MSALYKFFQGYLKKIDWSLLLFLVLLLNVKMVVKIAALVILLLLNRRMWKEKSIYRQSFAWFYCSLAAIALLNLLISLPALSQGYLLSATLGTGTWLACMAAALLNYWFVHKTGTNKLHETISLFFVLNAIVTTGQLLLIQWDAGVVNPYTYQGMWQKYFIGTGDLLTGISFDVSNTNALLNSFGLVYFLSRNKMPLALFCMLALALTASNFTTILALAVLLFLFIFQSTRNQKSTIVVCFVLLTIFMTRVSPQNSRYAVDTYKKVFAIKKNSPSQEKDTVSLLNKPDSLLTAEERKKKTATRFVDSLKRERIRMNAGKASPGAGFTALKKKPSLPKPDIHSDSFQRRKAITAFQKHLRSFAIANLPLFDTSQRQVRARALPGKLIAFQQTFHYLEDHPWKILTGNGMGNFSSKLAFRTTGLQVAGSYPQRFVYINDAFRDNHLNLYLSYFSKDIGLHSFINSPNSVYNQLISEYGLAGILCFILLYLGYFLGRLKNLSYGVPLLLITLGAFAVEYWYEQLSIVVLFELLMLLNNKETKEKHEPGKRDSSDAGL